jgi:glutathione S-transferase
MSNVDTSIDTKTTGAAGQLAAKHAVDHPLKLYGAWFCPFVQRAWIVLVEKKIDHQYIEINPYRKEASFLALNPRGLVPTLGVPVGAGRKETKPLYESIVLCEYLDEAHAEVATNGPALLPEDVYQRARCRLWIDFVGSRLVPSFYKFLQHTAERHYGIEEARQQLHDHIKTFARDMYGDGPWFLGERFSMVDVAFAPWAKRLWLIDYYKPGGLGFPEISQGGEDEDVWKRWREWLGAVFERPSVKETWSEQEQYIDVYRRYAEDTTNSLVGQATRKGHRLP